MSLPPPPPAAGGEQPKGPRDEASPMGDPAGAIFDGPIPGADGAAGPPAPRARRKAESFLPLLIVVAVSAAVLYGMRTMGGMASLDLVEIEIDYPLDASERATAAHDDVIDELVSSTEVVQVPLESIRMNPFVWKMSPPKAEVDSAEQARLEAERIAKEQERLERERRAAFSKLTLNSVMGGRVPVAMISGELVKVGDPVGEHFTVRTIEGRRVVLDGFETTWELTLDR